MDKKLTTVLGIALGATLLTGFGIYKYFSNKGGTAKLSGGTGIHESNGLTWDFIGNGLSKSPSLYGGGIEIGNGLVGGGLYKG